MARQAKFVVTLSEPAAVQVSVDYTTVQDSAVEGEDYSPQSGTLIFAPGETSKDVLIDLRATEEVADEQFKLVLSNPVEALLDVAEALCVIPADASKLRFAYFWHYTGADDNTPGLSISTNMGDRGVQTPGIAWGNGVEASSITYGFAVDQDAGTVVITDSYSGIASNPIPVPEIVGRKISPSMAVGDSSGEPDPARLFTTVEQFVMGPPAGYQAFSAGAPTIWLDEGVPGVVLQEDGIYAEVRFLGSWVGVRTQEYRTSGKWYFELNWQVGNSSFGMLYGGLCNWENFNPSNYTQDGAPPATGIVLFRDSFTGTGSVYDHRADVGGQWYSDGSYSGADAVLQLDSDALVAVGGVSRAVSTMQFSQPDLVGEFKFIVPSSVIEGELDWRLINADGYGMGVAYELHDFTTGVERLSVTTWVPYVGTVFVVTDDTSSGATYVPLARDVEHTIKLVLQDNLYTVYLDGASIGVYSSAAAPVPQNLMIQTELSLGNPGSAWIRLTSCSVVTLTGTADNDGYGDAWLDTFQGASNTPLEDYVPDVVAYGSDLSNWEMDRSAANLGDGHDLQLKLTGDGGLYMPDTNQYLKMRGPLMGQRVFYIFEFDFVLTRAVQAGESWDLYAIFGDGSPFHQVMIDFYMEGSTPNTLDSYVSSMGMPSDPGSWSDVESTPPNLRPVGQTNTVRLEVFSDYWRAVINGQEVVRSDQALELKSPNVRLEMGTYGVSSSPYKVTRVRVADTPMVAAPVNFLGDLAYTIAYGNMWDALDGPAGTLITQHTPNVGSVASVPANYSEPSLDGNGGLSNNGSSWGVLLGAPLQGPDYGFLFTFKVTQTPASADTLQLLGVRPFSVTINPDLTLDWVISSAYIYTTGSVPAINLNQEYSFSLVETARFVRVYLDGVLLGTYERAPSAEQYFDGQQPGLTYISSDLSNRVTVTYLKVDEFLATTPAPPAASLVLATFPGNEGDAVTVDNYGQSLNVSSPDGATAALSNGNTVFAVPSGTIQMTMPPFAPQPKWALDVDLFWLTDGAPTGSFQMVLKDWSGSMFAMLSVSYDGNAITSSLATNQASQPVGLMFPQNGNTRLRLLVDSSSVTLYQDGATVGDGAGLAMSGGLMFPHAELTLQSVQGQAFSISRIEFISNPATDAGAAAPSLPYPSQPVVTAPALVIQDSFGPIAGRTAAAGQAITSTPIEMVDASVGGSGTWYPLFHSDYNNPTPDGAFDGLGNFVNRTGGVSGALATPVLGNYDYFVEVDFEVPYFNFQTMYDGYVGIYWDIQDGLDPQWGFNSGDYRAMQFNVVNGSLNGGAYGNYSGVRQSNWAPGLLGAYTLRLEVEANVTTFLVMERPSGKIVAKVQQACTRRPQGQVGFALEHNRQTPGLNVTVSEFRAGGLFGTSTAYTPLLMWQDDFNGANNTPVNGKVVEFGDAGADGGTWRATNMSAGTSWILDGVGFARLFPQQGTGSLEQSNVFGQSGRSWRTEVGFACFGPNANVEFRLRLTDGSAFYEAYFFQSNGVAGGWMKSSTQAQQNFTAGQAYVGSFGAALQYLRFETASSGWKVMLNGVILGQLPQGPSLFIPQVKILDWKDHQTSFSDRSELGWVQVALPQMPDGSIA